LVISNVVILAVGATWLSFFVPSGQAWNLGVAPFISGAFAKSVIAWGMLPAAWKLVKR
jgi:biotin transport system substrate-specific component